MTKQEKTVVAVVVGIAVAGPLAYLFYRWLKKRQAIANGTYVAQPRAVAMNEERTEIIRDPKTGRITGVIVHRKVENM